MIRYTVRDLELIKNANLSHSRLKRQLRTILDSSGNYRAIVAGLNRMTGEYRIVLQGTLDMSKS